MKRIVLLIFLSFQFIGRSTEILIPMDVTQTNHLKAYGLAYWALERDVVIEWLLNYRGGSFMLPHAKAIEEELLIRGIRYELLTDGQANNIRNQIANPEVNQEIVQLEKPPKIAVYTPKSALPWDDAVTMALDYAEIPYDKIYDSAIVMGILPKYDWLHLHHEDFTGQYGKFYARYKSAKWYQDQVRDAEADARKLGFNKVSKLKLAVATNIRNFVVGGGFLFTMCSGTDSFDISLSAHNTDICESMYDGDASEPNYQNKLDFNNTLAFRDFTIIKDPFEYEYSNIDGTNSHRMPENQDKFTLFEFSAKWDIVPDVNAMSHRYY